MKLTSLDMAVAKAMFLHGTARSMVLADVKPYSTDWAHGGPIIEREGIELRKSYGDDGERDGWTAQAWAHNTTIFEHGPTPLIAAMRCFVSCSLGSF